MNCQYDFICYTSVVLGCGCRCHGLQMGSLIFRGQLGPESSRKGQQPRATPQSQSWVRQAGGVRGHGQPLGSMLRKVLGLQLLLEGARGRGRWREGGGSERGGKKDEGSVRDKREQHRGRDGSGVKKQIARGNEESMRRRRERERWEEREREREKQTTQLSLGCAPQPKRLLQRECIHDPFPVSWERRSSSHWCRPALTDGLGSSTATAFTNEHGKIKENLNHLSWSWWWKLNVIKIEKIIRECLSHFPTKWSAKKILKNIYASSCFSKPIPCKHFPYYISLLI